MPERPILLLTRPVEGSERFAKMLRARFSADLPIVIAPLQKIEWLNFAPLDPQAKALIFTSQNGVLGWNRDEIAAKLPAFCVGPQTAQAARAAGHDVYEAGGDAEALIGLISNRRPQAPLLHIRGAHARGRVAQRLTDAGIQTFERIAYRQTALPLSEDAKEALQGDTPVIAPLFSPRSVSLLLESLPEKSQPWVAVISPNAAQRVDAMLRRRMMVAKTPDAAGMLDAVEALFAASAKA